MIKSLELLHSEIQELQNELAIPDSYLIDIYQLIEDLRERRLDDE